MIEISALMLETGEGIIPGTTETHGVDAAVAMPTTAPMMREEGCVL